MCYILPVLFIDKVIRAKFLRSGAQSSHSYGGARRGVRGRDAGREGGGLSGEIDIICLTRFWAACSVLVLWRW